MNFGLQLLCNCYFPDSCSLLSLMECYPIDGHTDSHSKIWEDFSAALQCFPSFSSLSLSSPPSLSHSATTFYLMLYTQILAVSPFLNFDLCLFSPARLLRLCLGSSLLYHSGKPASRKTLGVYLGFTCLFTFYQESQSYFTCHPIFKKHCLVYFIQFSICLQQKVKSYNRCSFTDINGSLHAYFW